MKYSQLILVEYHNSEPGIFKVESSTPITIGRVVDHFEQTVGFDLDRDCITFVDPPEKLILD